MEVYNPKLRNLGASRVHSEMVFDYVVWLLIWLSFGWRLVVFNMYLSNVTCVYSAPVKIGLQYILSMKKRMATWGKRKRVQIRFLDFMIAPSPLSFACGWTLLGSPAIFQGLCVRCGVFPWLQFMAGQGVVSGYPARHTLQIGLQVVRKPHCHQHHGFIQLSSENPYRVLCFFTQLQSFSKYCEWMDRVAFFWVHARISLCRFVTTAAFCASSTWSMHHLLFEANSAGVQTACLVCCWGVRGIIHKQSRRRFPRVPNEVLSSWFLY